MRLYDSFKEYLGKPKEEKKAIAKDKAKNLGDLVKTHFVDCTAALAITHPIYATCERFFYNMPQEVSVDARLSATTITYLGIGSLISRGRDYSMKKFDVDDSNHKKIAIHDFLYMQVVNLVITPSIYLFSGASLEQTLGGTLGGALLAIPNGYLTGLAIDVGRDLMGIKESKRMPKIIKDKKPWLKKAVAVGTVAALVGLTSLVYKVAPEDTKFKKDNVQVSEVSE